MNLHAPNLTIVVTLVISICCSHGFILSQSKTLHSTIRTQSTTSQRMRTKPLIPRPFYYATPTDLAITDSISTSFSWDNPNVVVFAIGLVPFIWATIEFWRRIAVGASFGTGKDSVVIPPPKIFIGNDDGVSSRGRRTLGQGALAVAYLLFSIAAGIIALTLYSVLSTSIDSSIGSDPLSM
jgi:hypothetical protein